MESAMKQDTHKFIGMKRDAHPINQDGKYLWEAHNIRLTSRDGDSLLSITNERSTSKIKLFTEAGEYVGHSIVGNYLVLFTSNNYIYRVDMDSMESRILYHNASLNLETEFPIQAISDYESALI